MKLRAPRDGRGHEGNSHAGSDIAHDTVEACRVACFLSGNRAHGQRGQGHEQERHTHTLIDLIPENIPGARLQSHMGIAEEGDARDANRPANTIKLRVETIDYFLKRYREDLLRGKEKEAEIERQLAAYEHDLREQFRRESEPLAHAS